MLGTLAFSWEQQAADVTPVPTQHRGWRVAKEPSKELVAIMQGERDLSNKDNDCGCRDERAGDRLRDVQKGKSTGLWERLDVRPGGRTGAQREW